ncbi:hypothetical protein HYC85_027704 [Camellia sinensis]|uniref:CRESS-DNA virus Rep endonuclease domain-containing protein n=1 Tax=Camellia sinensis TaxID=4442 RepID=A0A7J7FT14_CAMSI|nr:hypothetical protein HYC85_027704 [Camellia sinensis]
MGLCAMVVRERERRLSSMGLERSIALNHIEFFKVCSETAFIPANRAIFLPLSGHGAEALDDNTPRIAEGSTNRGTTRGAGGASQTQNERLFDVTHDRTNHHFHPNVQGAYNQQNVLEYISKHGDYTEWGEFRERSRCANQNNKDNIY